MEGVKEFLESSSIHGLAHIANSKLHFARFLWFCIVVSAFVVSCTLINNSFISWSKSPIETSEETFPISKIPFPRVIVCPPKVEAAGCNFSICWFVFLFFQSFSVLLIQVGIKFRYQVYGRFVCWFSTPRLLLKGTNTQLNYDLMKADGLTIGDDERKELLTLTKHLLLEERPRRFAEYIPPLENPASCSATAGPQQKK